MSVAVQIYLNKFQPRSYQIPILDALENKGYKRVLAILPRRAGKDVTAFNYCIRYLLKNIAVCYYIFPTYSQGRKILWESLTNTGQRILDYIPKEVIESMNSQEMKIKLVNGSVIWVVGSDIDPDKLRGTNPRGIVYAEFAFQDPRVFHVMLPALRQNGGWMLGQSTFDGMNHFYQLIENNKDNPLWYCRVDSITNLVDEDGNRYITDEMIEEDRRAGMPEYLIQQEYYGVVQVNQETKYFAHAIKNIFDNNRLIPELIIPQANVYSAFDIGINDCTAIILFQIKRVDNYMKPVIIGYLENNNRDLAFYVMEIRRHCARYNLPFKDHFLPHDGQKRDFNTGKNTIDFMREMGESAFIVPRPTSKENAIEAMRRRLYLCDFNKENTQRLIDCLSNYSKEFDDKMGKFKDNPVHDWSSHGCDAFRYMAVAFKESVKHKPIKKAYVQHGWMG